MFRPKSLVHAFALARLQESCLNFRGIYYADLEVKDGVCVEEIVKLKGEEFSSEGGFEKVEVMEKVWLEQTETGMVMNLKEEESSLEGSFELMNSTTSFAAHETETKFNSLKFKEEPHSIAAPEIGIQISKNSSSTLGGGSDSDMEDVDVDDVVRNKPTDVMQGKILDVGHNLVGYPRVGTLALVEVKGAEMLSGGLATHFSTIANLPGHLEKLADDISIETVEGNRASVEVFNEVSKDTLLLGVRIVEAEMNVQESSSNWEVQTVGHLGKIHTTSRSRSRSEERGERNFEQQLVKQKLISQVDCLAPPLCLDTEFMSRGRVFDDLQNRQSILKLPVLVQLGIMIAEAEVEEPKHHTERVLWIFEELELEVKVYSGLRIMQFKPVKVAVADGNSLSCDPLCRGVKWSLQNTFFTTDVLLLPSGNCDMVLGFQWLENLGAIQWDFKNLSVEFSYQGKRHVLRGCAQGQLQSISSKSLDKILSQCSNVQFCYLVVKDEQQLQLHSLDCSGSNMIVDDVVALVLEVYEVVFKEPTSLLPFRDHNHQILLKEDTQAIANRPYRHTSVQKDVIEKHSLSRVHTSDIVCDQLGKKRMWVFGNDEGLRKKLIKLFHDSSIGCHSGIFVTHKRLAALSCWPHMEKHIRCTSTGYPPPIHIPYFKGDSAVHALDESLLPREATIQVLKHHLVRAQKRMKDQHDIEFFRDLGLGNSSETCARNFQISNLEDKVDFGWDDLIREKE